MSTPNVPPAAPALDIPAIKADCERIESRIDGRASSVGYQRLSRVITACRALIAERERLATECVALTRDAIGLRRVADDANEELRSVCDIAHVADIVADAQRERAEKAEAALREVTAQRDAYIAALGFYADPTNWGKDDWGCLSVVQNADYSNGGHIARQALGIKEPNADD